MPEKTDGGSTSPFRAEGRDILFKASRVLVNQLQVLIRTCQIHDIGNVALVRPATNLINALDMLFKVET